jgi:hypothetical protein
MVLVMRKSIHPRTKSEKSLIFQSAHVNTHSYPNLQMPALNLAAGIHGAQSARGSSTRFARQKIALYIYTKRQNLLLHLNSKLLVSISSRTAL